MSVFDYPRVNFRGTQRVNPATGNNNSLGPGDELTVTSDTDQVQPIGPIDQTLTDAQFVKWMEGADEKGFVRGQWNYYGDMSMRFDDALVNSVVLGPGEIVTEDPIIGAKVGLNNALVCDLNPEGFDCTQVFSSALQIYAPNAFGGNGQFVSRKPTRAASRATNWYRNVSFHTDFPNDSSGGAGGASATFILSFQVHKTDLQDNRGLGDEYDEMLHHWWPKYGTYGAPVSRAAAALQEALNREDVKGLQVRFNLYLCYPRIPDSALIKNFAAGEKTENPAIGWVLGTIAPWRHNPKSPWPVDPDDDPVSLTLARPLKPARSYVNPYREDKKPYYLGPAVACINESASVVSVDLINTLPEDGKEGAKFPLGTVTIGMRKATPLGTDPATNTAPIESLGEIANDKETFEICGGVYDLPVADRDVLKRLSDPAYELVLQTDQYGVLLYEPEYMVSSDCEGAYLDQAPPNSEELVIRPMRPPPVFGAMPFGTLPLPLRGYVPVYVRRRGKKPDRPVRLTIEQWKFTPTGDPRNPNSYLYPIKLGTEELVVENGFGEHELHPMAVPGALMFRYVAPGQWPPGMNGKELAGMAFKEDYTFLRVLPHDGEAAAVPDSQLDYPTIYRKVLRYYALILPAMSKRLNMSEGSESVWVSPTAARYLLRTTDVNMWERWAYMPRTRDLSATRRALLHRFCHKVLAESAELHSP